MLVIHMQVAIDCDDLTCINFTDTTKAYDAGSNPTGYGGPNTPEIADIQGVHFIITDKDGNEFHFLDSTYLPNADGTSEICLRASDFVNDLLVPIVFVKGQTYSLQYTLELGASVEVEATAQTFIFPCCGTAVVSNLGINFSITEKLGCSSIDFKDTTGSYNALTNPGGYGAPNALYSDIVSTLIKITRYDGTVITITDFKPTMINQIKNISAADLGYVAGTIAPQIMNVEYTVFVGGNCIVGYKALKMLFHCVIRNCITSKGKALLVRSCKNPCDDSERKAVLSLILRYEMMLLASYENIDCVADEVELLYDECKKYCGSCT